MKIKNYILTALMIALSAMVHAKSGSENGVRETFYKTRVEDTSLDPALRVAYMDSILKISPDDYSIRMIKSDMCYNLGRYDDAAAEYMILSRRHGDILGERNGLRALKMLAQSLSLGGHQAEASAIALELLHRPKADTLRHYDLTAINVIVGQALIAGDTASVARYLNEQDNTIGMLAGRGYITGDDERQYRFVSSFNRMTLLKMKGLYDEALKEAKYAKTFAADRIDSVSVDIGIADIYGDMGQYDIAIELYERNVNIAPLQFNLRQQKISYAGLLNKKGRYDDALGVLDSCGMSGNRSFADVQYLQVRGQALAGLGKYREAYNVLSDCVVLRDSLEESGNSFSAALREFEAGEARFEIDRTRKLSRNNRIVAIVLLILLMTSVVILVILVMRMRRISRERDMLQHEVAGKNDEFRDIRDENSRKDRQLVSSALSLTRMAESLASIEQLATGGGGDALSRIASEIKSLNYTKNVWDIFRTSFERLNPGFFGALTRDFPSLSIGEQRMAAYIVMGLTSKEIASIINRQPRTVETIKYRLRKELNLPADVTTADFLRRYLL